MSTPIVLLYYLCYYISDGTTSDQEDSFIEWERESIT